MSAAELFSFFLSIYNTSVSCLAVMNGLLGSNYSTTPSEVCSRHNCSPILVSHVFSVPAACDLGLMGFYESGAAVKSPAHDYRNPKHAPAYGNAHKDVPDEKNQRPQTSNTPILVG